ncbi:MAG: DNA recombination protein RmuC [Mycoplasmataceae bacterium]|nr:DNA recombination protein RmuC [Mycoplasmataceae bacterium]
MEKEKLINHLETNYKHPSLFKRIFAWSEIYHYWVSAIKSLDDSGALINVEMLKSKLIEKETNHEKELLSLEYHRQKELDLIENQKQMILQSQQKEQANEISGLNYSHNQEFNKLRSKYETELTELRHKKALELEETRNSLGKRYDQLQHQKDENDLNFQNENKKLHQQLAELESIYKHNADNSQNSIDSLLRIFNGSTGKQGKIAERILEQRLEDYFGVDDQELWRKNLQIKGGAIVEFAIRTSINDDKWVPVDSKNLIPTKDESGKYFVDQDYVKRIKTQVNLILKYINKENTASYALLVLPADWILEDLMIDFQEDIRSFVQKRVFITSRSTFIQLVQATSGMKNDLALAAKVGVIIKQIEIVEKHIKNFSKSVDAGIRQINIGFDKHYPNITKSFAKLGSLTNAQLISPIEPE